MRRGEYTRPTLTAEDVDPFLLHLFGDIARRPEAWALKETAAVARFLLWLAWDGVPSEMRASGWDVLTEYWPRETETDRYARRCLTRVAEIVWADLLRHGVFDASSKDRALGFLRKHAGTYLANPYIERAVDFVQRFDIPSQAVYPFRPPNLRSRSMNAQGTGNPQVKDDLRKESTWRIMRFDEQP